MKKEKKKGNSPTQDASFAFIFFSHSKKVKATYKKITHPNNEVRVGTRCSMYR